MSDVIHGRRNLTNYKRIHEERAKKANVHAEFMAASTYTKAKRILFGTRRSVNKSEGTRGAK